MGARVILIIGVAALLSGCWAPPSADVRPGGKPRLVEEGIAVASVDSARVESVDRAARTVVLSVLGMARPAYRVGPRVGNWDDVHTGDQVHVKLEEAFSVYAAPDSESNGPEARVLLVDPSYRLLTIQYPNRERETLKLGLRTPMNGIQPGDSVAIHPLEVIDLRVRRY